MLPTSGTLTLALIQDEFGAPRGTSLTEFVRGGRWVPNIVGNGNIPISPPISILQFYGARRFNEGPGGPGDPPV